MSGLTSAVYVGEVFHARSTPTHAFRSPIYYLLLDLDELHPLQRRSHVFGYNQRRPTSLWDVDHLDASARPIKDKLRAFLDTQGFTDPIDRVLLLTQCRVFGYVFNPISLFYCLGPDDALVAVVAEVHNTHGELHPYLLRSTNDGGAFCGEEKKVFHVSPFMTLDGTYHFAISPPSEQVEVSLELYEGQTRTFASYLKLNRQPLTERSLLGVLLRYPLMPQRVIGSIYWQALQLWRKQAIFHSKPAYDPLDARERTAA